MSPFITQVFLIVVAYGLGIATTLSVLTIQENNQLLKSRRKDKGGK